jgi:hypothetical protein
MPLQERARLRRSSKAALDLPPPFRLVTLREVGDAFAHATELAGEEGAGTLVYVGRFDLVEFALVLEPDEPLKTARRTLYAGLAALADALAVHAPPERPIAFDAATIRTVAMGEEEPGLRPLSAALEDEGFDDLGSGRLVESFARHFMVAVDAWQEQGFGAVAKNYLARLAPESGVRREIADNGDLLVRRVANAHAGEGERRSLLRALETPSWLDPATGGPRR